MEKQTIDSQMATADNKHRRHRRVQDTQIVSRRQCAWVMKEKQTTGYMVGAHSAYQGTGAQRYRTKTEPDPKQQTGRTPDEQACRRWCIHGVNWTKQLAGRGRA